MITRIILVVMVLACGVARAEDYFTSRAPNTAILDIESGELLYSRNGDAPVPPASMSKLMTTAIVFDLIERGELTLDTQFTVSERAWRTLGSKMFVLVDTEIRVEDLLKGVLVHSGNDAAIVLAENISGSEDAFVTLMNQQARIWGLENSTFANATGEDDPGHRMSANDLALLARRLWLDYPDLRYLFGIEEFTWSEIEQRNRNPLLGTFPGTMGMKTGFTDDAQYGVVGLAIQEDVGRIIVIAGMETSAARRREADRMMGLAFSEFSTRTFFREGDHVADVEVFGSAEESVPLRIDVPISFTMHNRTLAQIEARLVYDRPVPAPIREGELLGILKVRVPDEPEREYPVYAARSVPGLGPLKKIQLGLQMLFTPPEEPVF